MLGCGSGWVRERQTEQGFMSGAWMRGGRARHTAGGMTSRKNEGAG